MPVNQSCHFSHVETQKNLLMLNADESMSKETVTQLAVGNGHRYNLSRFSMSVSYFDICHLTLSLPCLCVLIFVLCQLSYLLVSLFSLIA